MAVNFINIAGLGYDIAGAFLLGRAVAFNSKEKIAQQVATAWNFNKHLIPVVVEGRMDAVVGLSLMILGFLLQAVSVFWNGELWQLAFSLGALALVLGVYKLMLARLVKRGTDRVIEFIEARQERQRAA